MKTEPYHLDGPSTLESYLKRTAVAKTRTYFDQDDSDAQDSRKSRRTQPVKNSACTHCKSLKVRCEFLPGQRTCQRCQAGNYECVPRTRKKRKPAPTHEDLQEKAYNQDLQIQSLLRQFDKLRSENQIKHWVERSDIENAGATKMKLTGRDKLWTRPEIRSEQASISFFAPVQGMQLNPPDIIRYCNLYPEEIISLFEIYFERINPFFSLLDNELHTPEKLIWTSPFLFTTICATASRYYGRPELYQLAYDFARDAAGKALIDGSKSIEACQAYLILSVYPVPKKCWAQDRSWLFQGAAITMAMELGLDQPPPPSCDEREKLNRVRTWLNCYCVDGSHAIQFGKMPMLRLDDYMARHSQDWYRESSMNMPFDVHLCAYVQLILIMAEWRALRGDGNSLKQRYREGFDVVSASLRIAARLQKGMDFWLGLYKEEYALAPLLICAYRGNTTQMITAYLRLVVLAVGFQYAVKSGLSRDSEVFKQSIDAGRTVIQIAVERLSPTGHLRYAMEANFIYVSFAAAYLINLLRPRFLPLLDEDTQDDIIISVRRLINVLGSKEVALDGRHTPAIHSRFLASLLAKYNVRPPRRSSNIFVDEVTVYPQYGKDRQHTPPHAYSWPDTSSHDTLSHYTDPDSSGLMVYQQPGDAEMDFSLTHFVKSVQDIPINNYNVNWDEGSWAWNSSFES